MSNKTPHEIRLELIQEARLILQAKAGKPEFKPTEEVIPEAEKLTHPYRKSQNTFQIKNKNY